MINVAEKLQIKYEEWIKGVTSWLDADGEIDEDIAFELFWARMSREDAAKVLKYKD